MSLTIELTPEETAKLHAFATARNKKPEDAARDAVVNSLAMNATAIPPTRDLIALLDSWIEEDKDIPQEVATAEVLELKKALNANRRELGERILFPDVPE